MTLDQKIDFIRDSMRHRAASRAQAIDVMAGFAVIFAGTCLCMWFASLGGG